MIVENRESGVCFERRGTSERFGDEIMRLKDVRRPASGPVNRASPTDEEPPPTGYEPEDSDDGLPDLLAEVLPSFAILAVSLFILLTEVLSVLLAH
jgi:hypothetical protein